MRGLALTGLLLVFIGSELAVPLNSDPQLWAVLVAGSNGFENYRHQADVCHAYQIFISHGVPPERIIVMMYDDIANNPQNPTPGKLYNKPNGPDVYQGVKIDYKGDDVNIANFRNVLLGNQEALKGKGSGRVLDSGPDDLLFLNFVDHGATGILAFPNEMLSADELHDILITMEQKHKYAKLLFYVEACESGSCFDNLYGENHNILVSTAAARDESSWACYCDSGICLGDSYSVAWMEHLDEIKTPETVFEEYDAVRTRVTDSHINLYGNYSIGFDKFGGLFASRSFKNKHEPQEISETIDSRDVPLHFKRQQIKQEKDVQKKRELQEELQVMTERKNRINWGGRGSPVATGETPNDLLNSIHSFLLSSPKE